MTFRARVVQYIKYNLFIMPVILAIYIPYNLLFIGYTVVQLTKWLLTAGLLSLGVNLILQPYQSFL
ncbi:MAG TPA: hypothetical protein VEP90_08110, partial [Methylomirabilota bacterium]|nr:hypothetical protein [Methylomirabilota bacterium]